MQALERMLSVQIEPIERGHALYLFYMLLMEPYLLMEDYEDDEAESLADAAAAAALVAGLLPHFTASIVSDDPSEAGKACSALSRLAELVLSNSATRSSVLSAQLRALQVVADGKRGTGSREAVQTARSFLSAAGERATAACAYPNCAASQAGAKLRKCTRCKAISYCC